MRWLDGITNSMDTEFEQTLGDGEEQEKLACCSPLGHKESDTTEQLNNKYTRVGITTTFTINNGHLQKFLISHYFVIRTLNLKLTFLANFEVYVWYCAVE